MFRQFWSLQERYILSALHRYRDDLSAVISRGDIDRLETLRNYAAQTIVYFHAGSLVQKCRAIQCDESALLSLLAKTYSVKGDEDALKWVGMKTGDYFNNVAFSRRAILDEYMPQKSSGQPSVLVGEVINDKLIRINKLGQFFAVKAVVEPYLKLLTICCSRGDITLYPQADVVSSAIVAFQQVIDDEAGKTVQTDFAKLVGVLNELVFGGSTCVISSAHRAYKELRELEQTYRNKYGAAFDTYSGFEREVLSVERLLKENTERIWQAAVELERKIRRQAG